MRGRSLATLDGSTAIPKGFAFNLRNSSRARDIGLISRDMELFFDCQDSLFRFDFCSVTRDVEPGGGIEVELGLVVSHCRVQQFRCYAFKSLSQPQGFC